MRLKRLTQYLLTHRWQTYLITFVVSFIPFIGNFGILLAGLVTLRKSIVEGAILTVLSILPLYTYLGDSILLIVAIASYVLTWALAVMLRRGASFSQLLQVCALGGALFISLVHMLYPEITSFWADRLLAIFKQAGDRFAEAMNPPVPIVSDAEQEEAVNFFKQYMTGIYVTVTLFMAILQLIVARWWEAVVYAPGTLRRELYHLRLSPLAGGLFILCLIFAYMGNRVVLDIMPILYGLFAASGLSLMHFMLSMMKSSSRWFWLYLMYLCLMIVVLPTIVLLAMLGLLDIWMDMRKRLQKV